MRFSTPSLGGQGESFRYLRRHGWQLSVGYRRLTADDWFVGTQISPPPGGEPLNFEIHTVDLNATFAVTERFNLTLTVPFISGKLSAKVWPDGIRHTQSSSGVGDVSLVGSMWLQNPATHSEGNVALGLGVKAATGSNSVSLGGRIDGLPVHDLLGGGDNGFRQPGYVIFVDPGVAVTRGREAFTLSVPVRVHANRQRNTLEWQSGKPGGGGDFAKALVFLGYSHRF